MDPYLYLLDGDGDVVAEDDDIDRDGGDYDSRTRVTLDPGDYTIEATTYSTEATAEFTLTAAGIDFVASEPTPEPTPPSAGDRSALVALYNSTGGANWTRKDNWLNNRPLGEWDGVTTYIYITAG